MMRNSTEVLHDKIKNSKLVMIPDCGHGVSLKFPEQYIELLRKHFAAVNSNKVG
jgi:pimeloyl-ACP methyl ester carboxylesterase